MVMLDLCERVDEFWVGVCGRGQDVVYAVIYLCLGPSGFLFGAKIAKVRPHFFGLLVSVARHCGFKFLLLF